MRVGDLIKSGWVPYDGKIIQKSEIIRLPLEVKVMMIRSAYLIQLRGCNKIRAF